MSIAKSDIVKALGKFKAYCLETEDVTDEITGKVITGEMKAELLEPLFSAVEKYYAPDVTLKSQVMYLITQIYSDWMKRNTEYENALSGLEYSANYPQGYFDIAELFQGGGSFPEILDATKESFLQAFTVAAGVVDNGLIKMWLSEIQAARAGELAQIETLLNFCKDTGQSSGLFIAFENCGQAINMKTKQEAAQEIYKARKYQWLIEAFGLNIYVPSYFKEPGSV